MKPKCKLCTELGAECIYREPGIKLDAGDKLILEHLTRIESLLQSTLIGQTNGLALSANSPSITGGTTISTEDIMMQGNNANFVSMIPASGLGTWTSVGTNISTMPKVHTNAALHLLQWPLIRDLVSRPYDPQILLQLEMAREPLPLSKAPCLDLSNTSAYIEAFFAKVNVWYACVNPFNWRTYYRVALSNGFREGPESCIVLLVLALGQASCNGSISRLPLGEDPPGLPYFAAAWALLPGLMTRNSVLSAQCTVLASAYLFYLVRPLEAWTLLSSTSTKLQLLLSAPGRVPAAQRELSERVYWNALLFESDLLAEMDLPHSGIVQYEESVGLPGGFEPEDEESAGRDDLWYFLAEIALRRLLNRVSQLIYSKDSMASTQSLEPVVAELDYQLTQWYDSLPLPLQFPYSRSMLNDPVQTVLRLRYFACKTIIYRPYILAVLDNEQAAMDPTVRENCRKCLEASIRQLEHITAQYFTPPILTHIIYHVCINLMSRQPCRTHALPLAGCTLHRQPDPPRYGCNYVCLAILNPRDPGPKPRHHRCDHQRRYPGDRAVFPSRTFNQSLKRDTQGGGNATTDFPWWISHSAVPFNTKIMYQHITTSNHDFKSRLTNYEVTTPRLP